MENEIIKNEDLFVKITSLIEKSRHHIATAVNTAMVITYFEIGRYIVQDEQKGSNRAKYGKSVLKELSSKLTERFEKGWSVENLQNIRNFYLAYSQKYETVFHKSSDSDLVNSVYEIQNPFELSWSHYLILMRIQMRIQNIDERNFYEIECKNQNWSVRQLSRQVNSSLYERLALSRTAK